MAAPSHAATEATPHGIWSLAVGIGVAAVRGQEEGGVLGHAREVEIEGQDLGARNVAAGEMQVLASVENITRRRAVLLYV
jgi:hypothetical protein